MDTATRAPRLHQVSPTTETNSTASATPATTLSTRCTALTTVLASVACTTSRSVRAAISGGGVCSPHQLGAEDRGDRRAGEAAGPQRCGPATLPDPSQDVRSDP